jgi:predicted metal-dependent hydrolase
MGRIVLAAYKPKEGKQEALAQLVKEHYTVLSGEGLVSNRQATLMQAQDGTIVEMFEWLSPEAIDEAHANAKVQALWTRFEEVCDFIPVSDLPESQTLFSEFTPL